MGSAVGCVDLSAARIGLLCVALCSLFFISLPVLLQFYRFQMRVRPVSILLFTRYMVSFILTISGPMWMKRVILYYIDMTHYSTSECVLPADRESKTSRDRWGFVGVLLMLFVAPSLLTVTWAIPVPAGYHGTATDLYADPLIDGTTAIYVNRSC